MSIELKTKINKSNEISKKFYKIKAQRLGIFEEFFESVESKINDTIKVNTLSKEKTIIINVYIRQF